VAAAVSNSGFGGWYSRGDAPAVLFAGTNDTTINYRNSVSSCQKARSFGNVCELHVYQGDTHGVPQHFSQYQATTARFLFRQLHLG
jgi:hypothetical protein